MLYLHCLGVGGNYMLLPFLISIQEIFLIYRNNILLAHVFVNTVFRNLSLNIVFLLFMTYNISEVIKVMAKLNLDSIIKNKKFPNNSYPMKPVLIKAQSIDIVLIHLKS